MRKAIAALDAAARERQARREITKYDPIFQKYTKRYFGVGTDWRWFKAQGMAESDLTPTARSRVGARGIMQLMPSTYGQIKSAVPRFGAIDHPEWNIAAGILHDRDMWTAWGKDVPEERALGVHVRQLQRGRGDDHARAEGRRGSSALDHSRWPAIETRRAEGGAVAVQRDAGLRAHDQREQGGPELRALTRPIGERRLVDRDRLRQVVAKLYQPSPIGSRRISASPNSVVRIAGGDAPGFTSR